MSWGTPFPKGYIPWNKGLKGVQRHSEETRKKMSDTRLKMDWKGYWLGKELSEEHRKKVSEALTGRDVTEDFRKKMSKLLRGNKHCLGRKHTEETKQKISLAISGPNHPCWKGGVSPLRTRIWQSREYKQWRKAVFERDDYTCLDCSTRGGTLNAHHKKSFAEYPELRFKVDNGQTLCVPCHNFRR